MNKIKSFFLPFLSVISLFFFTTPVLAGGWPVSTWSWDNPDAWRSGYKLTYVRAHLAPDVTCKGTTVTFKYENPQSGDNVSAGGENGSFTFTENVSKYSKWNGQMIPDCNTYAKFYSSNNALKTGIAEFKTADGQVYSARFALNFHLSTPGNTDSEEKYPLPWEEEYTRNMSTPSPVASPTSYPKPSIFPIMRAPEMIYPIDGQTLDLEGAYMFKVTKVAGASGYLFGLFQDGVMVYENYRDNKTLSSDGEFALWESNPFHAKFHEGVVKVMIRALVNNQWTDARTIFITLSPRVNKNPVPTLLPQPSSRPVLQPTPPTIPYQEIITVVTDSSASAVLQQKIEDLQKQLEQSAQRQSILEERLNQIINFIKSIFPFFR